MYSDLESDYINPIDLCTKLNQFTLPEMSAHAVLTTLFLLNGQWIALAINLPLFAFNANKYVCMRSPQGHQQDIFAGCNRDIPHTYEPQKGKFRQAGLLPLDILLLLVPVRMLALTLSMIMALVEGTTHNH